MGNNNSNLQTAKNIKDDEFYTTYEAIEKELQHYLKHFRGKVVLCNCDDPFKSNFCRYFVRNFNKLGLKRLICTSYVASEGSLTQTSLFDCNQIFTAETHGRVLDLKKIPSKAIVFTDDDIENFLRKTKSVRMLCGDGDFRSSECVEYLKQADIVVTNPPFSLFKELVALLVKYQKSYLLIGNQNALTYKEIFPLIQNNQAWTGYQFGDMKFRVPQSSEPRSTRYWVDESGQKWRSLGNAMWLTNLDIERRHEQLVLTKKYDPKEYPHYDTYDAINVRKVTDIPYDYAGIMGVPITIIDKYNSDQFEILGEANHGSDNEYDLFKPTINGKELFKRILIRNRMIQKDNIQEFRVLDLFSGAGGFSYGMEKNTHFKTVIALDFNEHALATFKHNMPDTEIVHGDITDSAIKKKIIKMSREKKINMIIGGPPCQGSSAARMIGEPQNFELIKILLQLITQTSSHESLKNSLSSLANENLQALTTSASLEGLKRVEALMRENLDNGKEEFWQQKVFNENQWMLAQIFSCPCTIYAQKAFVGGKSLDNKGGNVCDFIYRNKMTQNVALIEIKTPCTEIVGKPYRETYSMSLDMSGAVNQVLNYRDELQKNFSTLTRDLEEADTVRAFSPKCVVVIGKISTLNAKQQKAFELYRSSFNNLTIITFDELHQKICDLMSVFKEDSPRPVDSLMDEFSIIDEDYPI